jgi:hemolysin III
MALAAPVRVKPKLRGVFHEVAFFVAVGLAIPLAITAEDGKARLSAIVFGSCVVLCFGASALYHRPTWQPRARSWLARLDHAGIYLLIAGTYTPFGLLVLSRNWAIPVLTVVWSGATIAILVKLFWPQVPKRVSAGIGLALGWVAVIAFPELLKLPVVAVVLLMAGGVAYSIGAIVYARKHPDPYPTVFGYHELFHLLTLVAVGLQYAAIAFYVLPRG